MNMPGGELKIVFSNEKEMTTASIVLISWYSEQSRMDILNITISELDMKTHERVFFLTYMWV